MRAKFTIRVSSAKKEPWKLFRTILKAENIPKDYLNLKNGISGKGQLISLSKMVFYIMLEVEKRVLFHAKLSWIRRHNNLREC